MGASGTILDLMERCDWGNPWVLTLKQYTKSENPFRPHERREHQRYRTRRKAVAAGDEALANGNAIDYNVANLPWTVRAWKRDGSVVDAYYNKLDEAERRRDQESSYETTRDVRIFRG